MIQVIELLILYTLSSQQHWTALVLGLSIFTVFRIWGGYLYLYGKVKLPHILDILSRLWVLQMVILTTTIGAVHYLEELRSSYLNLFFIDIRGDVIAVSYLAGILFGGAMLVIAYSKTLQPVEKAEEDTK